MSADIPDPFRRSTHLRWMIRWMLTVPNLALWMVVGLLPLWSAEPPIQPQVRSSRFHSSKPISQLQPSVPFRSRDATKPGFLRKTSQRQLHFQLPSRQTPGFREGGGSRDQGCISSQPTLTALVPDTNFGYTTAPSPTLYWYVPPSKAHSAEFTLQKVEKDGQEVEVYRTVMSLDKMGGIAQLNLAESETELEIDQDYIWSLSLQCDIDEPSGNLFVQGMVQRIALSMAEEESLTALPLQDRPRWYAESGIWYDSLSNLVNFKHSLPNLPDTLPSSLDTLDSDTISQDWQDLLHSVNLDHIVNQPILPCCSAMLAHP